MTDYAAAQARTEDLPSPPMYRDKRVEGGIDLSSPCQVSIAVSLTLCRHGLFIPLSLIFKTEVEAQQAAEAEPRQCSFSLC